MSIYHISLLAAALVAAFFARHRPRSLLWIGLLAASFIVSVTYLNIYDGFEDRAQRLADANPWLEGNLGYIYAVTRAWLPPALIAGACDAVVCVIIWAFGKRTWEIRGLYYLVLGSVAVNLLYATGQIMGFPPIPDNEIRAIILEAINYAALLLIGGSAILREVSDGHHSARGFVGHILDAGSANLHKESRPSDILKKR